uniref:Uncharacterized protein n=1 Tax=Polytomella parva TaxID=51329 RepID=A0A7S0UY20_9CHLO|mmetsp:Transcript_17843/g.32583  ORF Transcript_17843/g.32583 Transcript_17843/m.32583 type:complete len:544 (+) Transcript_17843:76-1707(+)|eukprot:CAMPEP_0175040390 /NCGR_PEP_ID=MMETSP0052_2-20121109/1234_1 /TAXON_ID=51329 ORGANISM="Polytomella parva, Strain SAG 63-3" /NCGR_SAMPLE_ID=MMETSP0052_2 /ASSEMBLY_ACC=CAM_ASM_000194 /LENGTH=543 /DNA_ID=CAMNT_0016302591 /DNA_START=44 /DNA_END=1675 /DNA_ORIENTATION=-
MLGRQLNSHRSAVDWLTDLKKAKIEGATGSKPKYTIQDLLEKVNDPNAPEQSLIPTSPRSVEACFRLGIDPIELQYHPIVHYKYAGDSVEVARIRYEKYEAVRQERIKSLIDMRKKLVDDNWTGEPGKNTFPGKSLPDSKNSSSTAVEKEKARFDAMRKRHEKEMAQVMQSESIRQEMVEKQQRKQELLEARARELSRQKMEHDKLWMEKQRELNIQRAREETELNREARRLAEERYVREKEHQRKREAEEREIRRKALQADLERRQKAEATKMEVERIQAEHESEVQQRRQHMEQLDVERQKRLAIEAKEKAIQNAIRRKKADQRIQSAIDNNTTIMRKRRSEFMRREHESDMRRQEFELQRRRDEEARRIEEERKSQERIEKLQQVQEQEELRKRMLEERAAEKDRALSDQLNRRNREVNLRKVEKEFELKLRMDKADELQKVNLFQRQTLLEKILDDYERTRMIMRERQEVQERRKMANMEASIQRQKLLESFEEMRRARDRMASRQSGEMSSRISGSTGSTPAPGGAIGGGTRRPATAH